MAVPPCRERCFVSAAAMDPGESSGDGCTIIVQGLPFAVDDEVSDFELQCCVHCADVVPCCPSATGRALRLYRTCEASIHHQGTVCWTNTYI